MNKDVSLDLESLNAYRQRWQAVEAIETGERQATTMALRWQQLNALLRIAEALGIPLTEDDNLVDEVRQRWRKLTIHYLRSLDQSA